MAVTLPTEVTTPPGRADRPIAVVALGGNALLPVGGPITMAVQWQRAAVAAGHLAPLVVTHRLVVTHGNGPQIGLLAEQHAGAAPLGDAQLDDLGAETDGMIGYALAQTLNNAVADDVAALLTQVVVDPEDPAFGRPTKPVGPVIAEDRADALRAERGWTIEPRNGVLRRLVASPAPVDIVEMTAISTLVRAGIVTICLGGGGIPVTRADWLLDGIEGVVDKDAATALLAIGLRAERLILLTDVDAVYEGWGTDTARAVVSAGADWFRARQYQAGSMGPKVEACCRFATETGHRASIGSLTEAADVLAGRSGTHVLPGDAAPIHRDEEIDHGRSGSS